MAKVDKPDLTLHSGWCLKWPVSEYNEAEHAKCPVNFSTRSCACTCGHEGERSLEDRGIVRYEVTKPRKKKDTEDDS